MILPHSFPWPGPHSFTMPNISHLCPFSSDNVSSKPDATTSKPTEPARHTTLPQQIFDDIAEREHEPRQRTADFWIVLFIGVIPLWSVIPLSWAFVGYSLYSGLAWSADWPWRTVLALSSIEVRSIFSWPFCVVLTHSPSGTLQYILLLHVPLHWRTCSHDTTHTCRATSGLWTRFTRWVG